MSRGRLGEGPDPHCMNERKKEQEAIRAVGWAAKGGTGQGRADQELGLGGSRVSSSRPQAACFKAKPALCFKSPVPACVLISSGALDPT